ncbi:MAG: HAMP domain-containing histidine kinase, partial [Chitinophagales bacterium]|nr:HAMP domain-containing histidine kinase [Chitinophagales bacterium]
MKKINRIVLLMSISGSLLALFIFRWLQSEYIAEKMELQKDLFDQFISARERVTDSLIAKNLINPILNNPKGFEIQTINKTSLGDSIQFITTDINFDTLLPQKLNVDTSLPGNAKFDVHIENDSDLLYSSVKLFINKVHGPGGEENFFEKYIEPGDTVMLKDFFAHSLDSNHIKVKTVWTSNRKEELFPPPLFYYESHFFDTPFGAQIENYTPFLVRKIFPQIIFAFLLLLITSTAFIFSYRSLRNQMRLAAMKDDLISNISHELKTPVATVKIAIEAMQQMDPVEKKEKIKEYLGMAQQEMNRLDLLVNKVMNSILLDNGKQVFYREEIHLKKLIEETMQTMHMQLDQRNAHIHLEAADDIIIYADVIHIKGVLYNLIDNSWKYGNESSEIFIQLVKTNTDVILHFSDNGPG